MTTPRRNTLLTGALALLMAGVQAQEPTRLLARFDNVTLNELLQTGIVTRDDYRPSTLLSFLLDTAYVILTPGERDSLLARGIRGTLLLEHHDSLVLVRRALYGPSLRLEPPYHTYESLNREIDSLQRTHPNLIRSFTIGATTAEQLPIRAMKLSTNVRKDDSRPAILFNGCHHSDELLGAEICMAILRTFAEGYDKDPEITRWLRMFQIYVVPVINVDGYRVVTSGTDPRWRKNRRETNGDGKMDLRDGVDINRNYDFNWAHGGSSDPESERYRGPFPFSESENRAVASLARSRRFLASVTYHSQGEVIYYPWNWGGRKAPDDPLLTSIARDIAGSIPAIRGDSTYAAEYGAGLVGQSYPWLYGTLGTFDFVIETGKGASFPPPYLVDGIVKANLQGVRAFLRRAEGPGLRVSVTDRRTGKPLEAQVWLPAIETEEVQRRTTHPATGVYWRLLLPGKHLLIVSAPGYETLILRDVTIEKTGWTKVGAALKKGNSR